MWVCNSHTSYGRIDTGGILRAEIGLRLRSTRGGYGCCRGLRSYGLKCGSVTAHKSYGRIDFVGILRAEFWLTLRSTRGGYVCYRGLRS
jgi:hypothetical protein